MPHHLPGSNTFLPEFSEGKAPYEATRGGAETMYPEYILKLQNMTPAAAAGRSESAHATGTSKQVALATVAIASLVYSGVQGEARQAPQPGAGGGRGGRGAAPAAADAELHILHVQGNVHMLVGAGGNIALQIGDDGVLLVDTGLAANAEKVVAAIRTLTNKPIRYIVNTHVHPDHVGGNDYDREAGQHDRGRQRGRRGGRGCRYHRARERPEPHERADRPAGAVPDDRVADRHVHFEAEGALLQRGVAAGDPPARGHTDGDSIVYFRKSDVIVAGDLFVTMTFPVIDSRAAGASPG